jgi:hypothetical protein
MLAAGTCTLLGSRGTHRWWHLIRQLIHRMHIGYSRLKGFRLDLKASVGRAQQRQVGTAYLGGGGCDVDIAAHRALENVFQEGKELPHGVAEALRVQQTDGGTLVVPPFHCFCVCYLSQSLHLTCWRESSLC